MKEKEKPFFMATAKCRIEIRASSTQPYCMRLLICLQTQYFRIGLRLSLGKFPHPFSFFTHSRYIRSLLAAYRTAQRTKAISNVLEIKFPSLELLSYNILRLWLKASDVMIVSKTNNQFARCRSDSTRNHIHRPSFHRAQ